MSEPQYFMGWVPSRPDFRDFKFSAPDHVLAALPPTSDLSLHLPPFEPALAQGQLGSCGPHTAAKNLIYDMLADGGATALAWAVYYAADGSVPVPSRLFIYYCTRLLMGTVNQDSGVDNRTMLQALNKYGWCDETLWPYNPAAFRQKPPQQCFDQAATRKIVKYEAVPQDLDHMKACLVGDPANGVKGRPFVFGFSVYENMMTQQVARTGVVPMPGGRQVGGHDVLIVGYDDAKRLFKFQNHWDQPGQPWGDGGYGYMPYEYATNPGMAGDFWVVTSAASAPLPPSPPSPPTPAGKRVIAVTQADLLALGITGIEVKA